MGIKDLFSKLRRKKRQPNGFDAIESDSIAAESIESLEQRSKSPEEIKEIEEKTATIETPSAIEVQKDSLQLGVAAGYTGRSIKQIESSLSRIETQMPTRDWLLSQFEDRTPELINSFEKHEKNEQKRFEAMQNILLSLQKTAEKAPEPIKTEISKQITAIERQLPLTPKMKRLFQIVKEAKEISYDGLHIKLGITTSALRGLLSNMAKRTGQIERFEKDGKGWVRHIEK